MSTWSHIDETDMFVSFARLSAELPVFTGKKWCLIAVASYYKPLLTYPKTSSSVKLPTEDVYFIGVDQLEVPWLEIKSE